MRVALRCAFVWLLAAICGLPAAAFAVADGSLGVYADATGTLSTITFSLGVPRTLYIVAKLDGQTTPGFTGAEFRVQGMPADWLVFVTPNPAANVVLGDPFRISGGVHRANIAFNGCTAGAGMVVLYTAVVIPQSVVLPQDLTVEAGSPPTNPGFTTPIFTLCDLPDFTKIPAAGIAFHFDVRAPQDLDYSALPGYDSVRGVQPVSGAPGDVFHFRVSYSNSDNTAPAPGSPRIELDANGDGDVLDAGEGAFTMSAADQDSNLTNGKQYRYDVALGAPPGGHYRYRFTAVGPFGTPVTGAATAWNDSLFVSAVTTDLVVRAEDVRVFPQSPAANATTSIFARVENNSDVAVHDVFVRVEDVFGNVIQERNLAVMGPHSATDVGCTWRFPDPGFQPVYVRVDPAGTIAERTKDNNLAAHGVNVGAAPGSIAISGIPGLVNVPPVAPFGLSGHAQYPAGPLPGRPAANARVTVRPSWEPAWTLRAGASGDFNISLTPPAAPGTYPAVIAVSDGARTDSAAVSVVVAPFQGNQGPHLPNLVTQISAVADPSCPPSAASVTVHVTNTGDVASAAAPVRLLLDGTSESVLAPLGALLPGASASVGPVQVPLGGAGLHTLTAIVDPGNTLRELRKDDNFAFGSVQVQAGCFDLALAQARITAQDLCTTTTTTFSVRVTNTGCGTSQPARVAALASGQEFASAALGALAPGASGDVVFTHAFGLGCNDLSFVADPDGAAGADCDASSNALSLVVCLGQCGAPPPPVYPNFTINACDVAATPSVVAPGSSTVFSAFIANAGQRDAAHEVLVWFRIDGVLIGDPVPVGPLATGARALATATVPWTVDLALHRLAVSIDPVGQEGPGDGTDNGAVRDLPWNLRLVANTSCGGPESMFSQCTPCPGTSVDVRAAVVNDGLFTVGTTTLEFRDGGVPFGTLNVHDVPPVGSCGPLPAPVSLTQVFAAGFHQIRVVVNPDSALAEPTHDDNVLIGGLNVACVQSADLTASVALPPGLHPAPGDTIRSASVTVRNLGNLTAFNVLANLSLDGRQLCGLPMGDIPGGGSSTRPCTAAWVVMSTGCVQILEACADPFNAIGESNETNNCGRTCLTGNPDIDLAIFSSTVTATPPNPSVGQTVILQVGLFNFSGVAASCAISAKWALGDVLFPIGTVAMTLPDGPTFYPNAATFVWVVPIPPPVQLVFTIDNIVPHDTNPANNTVLGQLPWFTAPGTPVTVSDWAAQSTADGVRMRWRCSDPMIERFWVERRLADTFAWQRLSNPVVGPAADGGTRTFEFLDREAPAGAQLEYRLVAEMAGRQEELAGLIAVRHDAPFALGVRLLPVRPQPFRAGNAFEFALPAARDVQLEVFDSAGRRVAVLAQGSWPAGRHTVAWNGSDTANRRVPAGVYFCRLASESYRETRRVVLVR